MKTSEVDRKGLYASKHCPRSRPPTSGYSSCVTGKRFLPAIFSCLWTLDAIPTEADLVNHREC